MWTFLSDLYERQRSTLTIVVVDDESVEAPQRHHVRPRDVVVLWMSTIGVAILLTTALIAFTPIRTLVPGYGTEEVRRSARLSAMRVAALQDSLSVQQQYIKRLQQLMTGKVEPSADVADAPPTAEALPARQPRPRPQQSEEESHGKPAMTLTSFSTDGSAAPSNQTAALPSLRMPMTPPVETGFPTRGFDAREGHYAIDVAVEAGSTVYSIGDGYVIFSDWTNDGGFTIAVQHADGYVSVYKHNQRLVKRVGDRVQRQEAVAISGNSGEITTGPHLHFELWHHGLAQDPRPLFEGW